MEDILIFFFCMWFGEQIKAPVICMALGAFFIGWNVLGCILVLLLIGGFLCIQIFNL